MTAIWTSKLLSSPGSEDRLDEKGLPEVGKEEEGEEEEGEEADAEEWKAGRGRLGEDKEGGPTAAGEREEFLAPSGAACCLSMLWMRLAPPLGGNRGPGLLGFITGAWIEPGGLGCWCCWCWCGWAPLRPVAARAAATAEEGEEGWGEEGEELFEAVGICLPE